MQLDYSTNRNFQLQSRKKLANRERLNPINSLCQRSRLFVLKIQTAQK